MRLPELFLLCVIAAIAKARANSNTTTKTTAAQTEHGDNASVQNEQRVPEIHKRSDDFGSRLTPMIDQLTQRVTELEAQVQALQGSQQVVTGGTGTVYTRWGEQSCPGSAELVYSGTVGGSNYADAGAAANYLCLPLNPVFDNHTVPAYHAFVYGGEYHTTPESSYNLQPTCAVCRAPRGASIVLPATDVCTPGWTREYSGYLMANYYGYPAASEYVCVDSAFGSVPGTEADTNGNLLSYTIFECGSLSCPPYVNHKVVLCAVCTK